MSERITVKIDPEGEVTISTLGFKGRSCLAATKQLEEDLGIKTYDAPTAEYHEQEQENENPNYARR